MNFINKFTCNPRQLEHMIKKLHAQNTPPIIDYIHERAHYHNFDELRSKIHLYPRNVFAIKLSSFGVHYNENLCIQQVETLLDYAQGQESTLCIDAEEHDIQERIANITDYFMEKYNQKYPVVYKTYQMYKKDMNREFYEDVTLPRDYKIGIKLVRGAYLKEDKPKGVLCDKEEETHKQYDQALYDFVSHHRKGDRLLCATHNLRSIYLARHYIKKHKLTNIEFAQLLGMADNMTNDLQENGFKVYKYLPYGSFHQSIPYLLRRLYENYPMMRHLDIPKPILFS